METNQAPGNSDKPVLEQLPAHLRAANVSRGLLLPERALAAISGIVLGDSLGLPVETMTLAQITARFGKVCDFLSPNLNAYISEPNGGAELPLGIWSDDTQLTLALMKSIVRSGGLDVHDIARAHLEAKRESDLGWGPSVKTAIERFEQGVPIGHTANRDLGWGNGVIMKLLPIAAFIACESKPLETYYAVLSDLTLLTHYRSVTVSATFAMTAAARYCLLNTPKSFNADTCIAETLTAAIDGVCFRKDLEPDYRLVESLQRLSQITPLPLDSLMRECGGGKSEVYHSLPTTLAIFMRNPFSYEALLEAVNAGGDTDSNASMVGGLLGALNGSEIFPAELLHRVHRIDDVLAITREFSNFLSSFGCATA